jgi:replicative DNA helicase
VTNEVTLASIESEQSTLGAVLLGGNTLLERIVSEVRLTPADFWRDETHGVIFGSMLRIYDAGGNVDPLTVSEDLKRHGDDELLSHVEAVTGHVPNIGNAVDYARRVKVLAGVRRDRRAGWELVAASENEDSERRDAAIAMLMEGDSTDVASSSDPDELAEMLFSHLSGDGGEVFPYPFDDINDALAGGARRGEVTIVCGHSSHGKTVIVDQMGSHFAELGLKVHAWINEMTRLQRTCRLIAAPSGVPFSRILRGNLTDEERARVVPAMGHLPFGITEVAGWSAEEIARDIRRQRPDVAIVDILHMIPHGDEKDLSRISRVLNGAAKQANCYLQITGHLNEGRKNMDGTKPAPTVADIKGSGSIKNDADHVFFIHQDQEEGSGQPKGHGWFYSGKVRNGAHWKFRVALNDRAMRFEAGPRSFRDQVDEEEF